MHKILLLILLLTSFFGVAQASQDDIDNLVRLGEIYSSNSNASGEDFKKSVNGLRTPKLNRMIDTLIALGQADKKLLTAEVLDRPGNEELKFWYVLREIHYNIKSKKPRPNDEVAKEVLEQEIDERWLLDNYYYRIHGGIASLFNTQDLRGQDFDLNGYKLKNETEKAILYFSLTSALTQRFRVLQMVKNSDKLLEFASKLPSFNGKPYYEFTSFDFDDFDWIGFEKTESYKERHIGSLYATLVAHYFAEAGKGESKKAGELHSKSILSVPVYFKYSGGMEKNLKELYEQSKN